jgi:L-threonylcarbamoyladenylate synthase
LTNSRIIPVSDSNAIEVTARTIQNGGLVAFPTETVYGLGADAENPIAVARIFEVKARPRIDPLIVHVADRDMAEYYGVFPQKAHILMEKFWPGPLTIVVPKKEKVPAIVTAGLDTVAIRIPAHPAALDLIRASGCAIAAPSANLFGCVSPTEAQHVAEYLSDKVDWILDGGSCTIGLESTILSLSGGTPCILGSMDIANGVFTLPKAPGQMERHYATHTPMDIIEENREEIKPTERVGLLCFSPPGYPHKFEVVETLSNSGNMREAAANLFRSLHRLDRMKLDRIIARPVPEKGLGIAIMDRLRRCSRRGLS